MDHGWSHPGGGTSTPTDLSLGTRTTTTMVVNSSTGTNVTLPAATSSYAGLFTSAEKTKLNGLSNYSAGTGLSLSGNVFSADYGTTSSTAARGNDSRINNGQTAYSWGDHAGKYLALSPITTGEATNYSGDMNELRNAIVYDANGTNGQGVNSTILSLSGQSNYGFQLSSRNQNRFKYRSKEAGVWSDWQTIWTSAYLRSNSENDARYFLQPTGSTSQYIRGDGSLATYANTTYSAGQHIKLTGTTFSGVLSSNTWMLDNQDNQRIYTSYTSPQNDIILKLSQPTGWLSLRGSDNATLFSVKSDGNVTASSFSGNLAFSYLTDKPTNISGYGITDAVPTSRTISAGTGLTGGGNLSANRSLSVSFGTASGTVAQGNDSRINNGQTAYSWGNYGDYGLGTEAKYGYSNDLNNINTTSFRQFSNVEANRPGFSYGTVLTMVRSSDSEANQIALPVQGTVGGIRWRASTGGNWFAWREIWDSGNFNPADYVPNSRTVNGKALSSNISLTASDVGAVPISGNATVTGSKTFSSPVTGVDGTADTHFVTKRQIPALASQGTGAVRLVDAPLSGMFSGGSDNYLKIGTSSTTYSYTIPAGTFTGDKGMLRISLTGTYTAANATSRNFLIEFSQGGTTVQRIITGSRSTAPYTETFTTNLVGTSRSGGIVYLNNTTMTMGEGVTIGGSAVAGIDFREAVTIKFLTNSSDLTVNVIPVTIEVADLN